jgi:hypothetical protein
MCIIELFAIFSIARMEAVSNSEVMRFEVLTAVAMNSSVLSDVISTDVSEGNVASIFRVEHSAKLETACYMLHSVSFLKYSSTMMTEETCSSETPVDFEWTKLRYFHDKITLKFRDYFGKN